MKLYGKIFLLTFIMLVTVSCTKYRKERIKVRTEAQLIGTWRAWYGIAPCKYSQIVFNEDGTGTFTYLGENDSLIIDPPCKITWYVYVNWYQSFLIAELRPFLAIVRLEKNCVGCERRFADPPDTTKYLIDYINEDSMKVFLWAGSRMTTIDPLGCEGGGLFSLASNKLYKQK